MSANCSVAIENWNGSSMAQPDATVFVIDDDVSVRESLEALIALAGCQVVTFDSAQAFLDRARAPGQWP